MITAIDVSSHQPRDLSGLIAEYNPDLVIVRLYQKLETPSQSHTRDQVQSTRDNGKAVGGYWWPYHLQDIRAGLQDVAELADRCGGLDCPIYWADIETYPGDGGSIPDAGEIATLIEAYDELRIEGGVYTSTEMWRRAGSPEPANLWNWTAAYNGRPDLTIAPYGGWAAERIIGHQWTSTPIDQSVFNPVWIQEEAEGPTTEDLVNLLGYLQGDVATAIREPLEEIRKLTSSRLGVSRSTRIRTLATQALVAIHTLETTGK